MGRTPHFHEEEKVELGVDEACQDEACDPRIRLHEDVEDHVEEARHATLVGEILRLDPMAVRCVANDQDRDEVDNCDEEGQSAHLHIVLLVKDFEFARE